MELQSVVLKNKLEQNSISSLLLAYLIGRWCGVSMDKITIYSLFATITLLLSLSSTAAIAGGDKISCKGIGQSDTSMDAQLERRDDGRVKFDASYEAGANAGHFEGDELSVYVAGVMVGSIVLAYEQLDLSGDLEFDTNIDSFADDSVPFPSDFPAGVGINTSVMIGSLGCSLD